MENKQLNVLKKIHKVRNYISTLKNEKNGWNDYSRYNYFKPDYVSELIQLAEHKFSILVDFDLKKNDGSIYGVMTITDLESGEEKIYYQLTEIPDIKATNISQKYGGCVTFTKRYLQQGLLNLSENKSDFDDPDNQKKVKEAKEKLIKIQLKKARKEKEEEKEVLTEKHEKFGDVKKALKGDYTMEQVKSKYKVSPEVETLLI